MGKSKGKKQDKATPKPSKSYPTTAEYTVNGQKAIVTRVFREPPGDSTTDILLRILRQDVEADPTLSKISSDEKTK